jgi:hypothetical protein
VSCCGRGRWEERRSTRAARLVERPRASSCGGSARNWRARFDGRAVGKARRIPGRARSINCVATPNRSAKKQASKQAAEANEEPHAGHQHMMRYSDRRTESIQVDNVERVQPNPADPIPPTYPPLSSNHMMKNHQTQPMRQPGGLLHSHDETFMHHTDDAARTALTPLFGVKAAAARSVGEAAAPTSMPCQPQSAARETIARESKGGRERERKIAEACGQRRAAAVTPWTARGRRHSGSGARQAEP